MSPEPPIDPGEDSGNEPEASGPEEAAPEETASPPRKKRRRPRRGQELPVRYLLDSRLFRTLCLPGREGALEGFRASLQRHGLAPECGLPPLELTPMAFLEVIDIELPELDPFPLPASVLKSGESVMATSVIVRLAMDRFRESPGISVERLTQRVEELRPAAAPAAHDLFDLCLAGFVSREEFQEDVYRHMAFDYLYRFQFPEVLREEVFEFLCASLFAAGMNVAGLSKMRIIKQIWDRAYERLLKGNVGARGEIQALDREMKLRTRKDYLEWEAVHYAVLGHPDDDDWGHPVTAFTPDPEERCRTRAIAYKTALRAFLDQIERSDLANIRPHLDAWRPGVLVPCREDGTFETPIATGELPLYLAARKGG
ncbi:MAG TPA: hypothetical protein VEL74_25020 [Thermoanaerobaculia bacterium]|nr:hypothetical protein [Thermoanaerobaculia bacterium]